MSSMRFAAAAALMCLAACDSRTARDFREERSSKLYQSAMGDYAAGRLDAAEKGFVKVLRANPANSSARFQLACLQHDRKQDYLAAICNYNEYLLLAPDSDKAALAKERLAICKKLLVDEMLKKTNPDAIGAEAAKEAMKAAEELKQALAKKGEELEGSQAEVARLQAENARLRKLMSSIEGGDEGIKQANISSSVTDLLDEEEPEEKSAASALDDAKMLNSLAEAEESRFGTESSLLPKQAEDAKDKKKAAEESKRRMEAARKARLDAIPDTYVVQDGDTLYKIALRFYGRSSAWKSIREANKEIISTDGRVRAGMTIKLPK